MVGGREQGEEENVWVGEKDKRLEEEERGNDEEGAGRNRSRIMKNDGVLRTERDGRERNTGKR